jgi:hypothetical protein
MSTGLGREDIRALLDDLSAELAARGARAELFLVRGAALAVAYDATRATRDLDAVFVPTGIVWQAAAAVAEHRGLTEDWLNDAVKGFLPGPDPDAQRFYSSDSLIVDVASPRYLARDESCSRPAPRSTPTTSSCSTASSGSPRWTKALTLLSRPIQDGRSGEGEIPPHRNRGLDAAIKSTTSKALRT